MLKAAVNAGTLSTLSTLAPNQLLGQEFLAAARPLSAFQRLAARRVPFKSLIPRVTTASGVSWVGEGLGKPLSELALDQAGPLPLTKLAGIVVISAELSRATSSAAEDLIRADLAASAAQFVDARFFGPAYAAGSASPASISYGVTPTASSGSTAIQIASNLEAVVDSLIAGGSDLQSAVWVMSAKAATKLAAKRDTAGAPAFPFVTARGGELFGLPILVSSALGSVSGGYQVLLLDAGAVLLADDGIVFDVADQAALQMDSTPTQSSSTATTMVSLWSNDLIAIKIERYVGWLPARATGVCAYLDGLAV